MGRRHEFGFPSRIVSRRRFQFLAFFKCHELPWRLFERICQPSKVWNDEGEIVECSETIIGLDSDLENLFQEAKDNEIIKCFETLLSQTYVVDESWKQWLSFNTDDRARRNIQFNILELVLKAFPTPYTEISWMEVESQMLDIVQTTCVPFLCILDMKDVTEYLNDRNFDREKMTRYLAILAKFLIRLSKLMGDSTPATIDPLISSCLEYLKEWPGVKSLHLARAINREQIENLDHCGINYLNGVIGLGLASILTSEESSHCYKYNHQIEWHPFETSFANSTIELLAQAELYGAISLATLQGVVYNDLPLTTRVLIAFSEVKLESYDNARNMLGPILDEVKRIYGSQSMEVFLVGTTLVNCLNRCRMEALAEELVNSIFRKAVNQLEMPTTTQEFLNGLSTIPNHCTNSELSMVVAFADSLLGQGKHDDALSLFQAILKKRRPGREDITMSVALRIIKITRRLNIKSSTNDTQNLEHSDAWEVLRVVLEIYPRVSSILKYAYVEEVICHLSLLEDKDTRQRFVASEIIKVLNLESTPYKGSESSRISFFENLQTINQYTEKLKSQLIKKEPESLTGKMAQRFSDTTVDLVEMISPRETQSITPKSTNSTAFHQALSPRASRPGLTPAVELAASLREKLLEERKQRLSIHETRARSQRPNKYQETNDMPGTDYAPTVKRSSRYQDSNQEIPPPLKTKRVRAALPSRCAFCNRANTIQRRTGPDGEEIYWFVCEPCDALRTYNYPNQRAEISHLGSFSNLSLGRVRPMDQNNPLMICDSTNGRRESFSQSRLPHIATQPQSIAQHTSEYSTRDPPTAYQYTPGLTYDINPLMGAERASDWNSSAPKPKVSNENTDWRVKSSASINTGGNKPALASSHLPGQRQTHQIPPHFRTIDEIGPKFFPNKCPDPRCVIVSNRVYEGLSDWLAHYDTNHKECHACGVCNAIFGTEAEIRPHLDRHRKIAHESEHYE